MQKTSFFSLLLLGLLSASIFFGGIYMILPQKADILTVNADFPLSAGPDLVGRWKFDGNYNNEVSGKPSATPYGGGTNLVGSGGIDGGYVHFTGQTDYLNIVDDPAYDLPISFTIAFWFRHGQYQGNSHNFVRKGTSNYNFQIDSLSNDYIRAGFHDSGALWRQASNPTFYSYAKWHYLVYIKNTTFHGYYIDAKLINGQYETTNAIINADPILIGSGLVNADFDDLRIYNYSISEASIEAEYKNYFPIASFNVDKTSVVEGTTDILHFSDTTTGGKTPYTYYWTFGDGGNTNIPNPNWNYVSQGNYWVNLTVTDSAGNISSKGIWISVSDSVPTVSIIANATSILKGQCIKFNEASSSFDPISSRAWNFGDGYTSTVSDPDHFFYQIGTFTVNLTVTDNDGSKVSSFLNVQVNETCGKDRFEPNDIWESAQEITQTGLVSNLTYCEEDWYKIKVKTQNTLTVILHEKTLNNVTLEFYWDNRGLVSKNSTFVNGQTSLSVYCPTDSMVYIRIRMDTSTMVYYNISIVITQGNTTGNTKDGSNDEVGDDFTFGEIDAFPMEFLILSIVGVLFYTIRKKKEKIFRN